jgi:6-phosphogluconolactonase/glucosamine-6-phosphate isomerase/deaminase
MLQAFSGFDLPWPRIFVAQVDERVAPPEDARRNLARLVHILVSEGPLPAQQLLAMPVERADLEAAAQDYQRALEAVAGAPLRLDLVQLGLGSDGHTASLVPGDGAPLVVNRDAAVTQEYHGLRRMTLTYPALNRARRRLWLVTGAAKAASLRALLERKGDAPAMAVSREDSLVVADEAALGPGAIRGDPSPG